MLNKNKIKFYLGLLLFCIFGVVSVGYVNASTFAERLSEVGLDVASFSNKNSISRYEVTRLLNAADCQDCIQAPDWMKQTYGQKFWDEFRAIDGKDFNDVSYEAGVWNKKSYYYCVAYVGDNGYMAGYPSTSTKCKGNFCGQEPITISEFYQTVLNIIQNQIRQKYLIDRSKVKSWKKGLKKNSIQMRTLNQTNIDVIDKVDSKIAYAQNNDEFQTWLKYCMYNLSACNFQPFGVVGTGYWPVSELNVLYREGVITFEDAQNVASFSNMRGDEAIRIFSLIYDNYASCSFNVDYDCDSITNGDDNCPYVFNSNQYDLDDDGVGNVCDDDIDGDGKKNLIGVVDDNNRIVVSMWQKGLDQTPLGNLNLGFSFFVNIESITREFPTAVVFEPVTNGNIIKIEWDFGDGVKKVIDNGGKVRHVFKKSGSFTVKAVATSKGGSKSFATNRVFIAASESENYALNIQPRFVFKNGGIDYTFIPLYSGDLDKISWNINNQKEETHKLTENFNVTIKENGKYVVTAKGYKNGDLKAVAMFTMLQDGSPKFSSVGIKPGNLWEDSLISSNLVGLLRKDIGNVTVSWGGSTSKGSDLVYKHAYDEPGLKTIQYDLVLNDGSVLNNVATINVQNPLLMDSYAVNIRGDRLGYNQDEKLALGLNMYPKTSVMSLFTSYQAGQKRFLYNPDFSKTLLDFSYSSAGDKLLTNLVEVNRCVALLNQGTVHINSMDICENAMKNGTLSGYKCDQDGDKIPDICDDDIDGDGVKNLIGIILHENKDCSIGENNINSDLLEKEMGVCSLDNCPFASNSDQSDLNNNGIGDVCEEFVSKLLSPSLHGSGESSTLILDRDQDGDGVPDNADACIDIPGNSDNGCPEQYSQNCWIYSSCGNGKLDEGEDCHSCPQDAGLCCGNGVLDYGESCKTCPVDAGSCKLCGNGKIDAGENCRNCPKDVGECSAFCGNGEIEEAENCRNCPEDVKECSAVCGDGKIGDGEDCENCSKDVKMCISTTCGDGKIDKESGEECDNGKNNGKDKKCTLMCTKYDPNKPKCGNGEIDAGEDCETCPVDLGGRCVKDGEEPGKTCGNGKIDAGENCRNCPKDVGECSAFCGNGEIEEAENCRNCPEDVKECSAVCGDGKIGDGEDCENCSKDVKMCISTTCGDGKIDKESGEECDNGKNNGKDKKCTLMCTKYDPNKPKCGNGEIDAGEDCKTCPVDLGGRCVKDGEEPGKTCGNGKIDAGENCRNCPKDVGECSAFCGNGEIEEAENCRNCPEDVKECSAVCGDGKIGDGEDCENCSKDVKMCISTTCGDGKIDKESGEECDNGKNNGKDKKCTLMCTKYDPNKPKCGNGEIDAGEDCETCPVDLGGRCVKDGEEPGKTCGNGKIDAGENCRNCPKDVGECSAFCGNGEIEEAENCRNCPEDVKECSAVCGDGKIGDGEDCENCSKDVKMCISTTCGDGKIDKESGEECDNGKNNGKDKKCTLMCTKYDPNKPKCGNGEIDAGEDCKTCPVDLGGRCVKDGEEPGKTCGNGKIDAGENCKNCPKDVGECSAFCGNGEIEEAENCRNCPEDVKECSAVCGDGKIGDGEDCENCSKDVKMCISTTCGDGKIDKESGEECDNGKNNGKDKKCTLMCTKYDPNKPKCGNGEIDAGEDCETCPVDLGGRCVKDGEEPGKTCGNGKIDAGENCRNCPKDVGECSAFCGNGEIEEAENCRNCPEDVKECSAVCGDGKIGDGEDCENCSKDVKMCISTTCGDGKIDKESGEECDNGKNNGKDKKCTLMCTKYDPNKPKCGNGEIDAGEDCETCPVDLGGRCVKDGEEPGKTCGNGKIDAGEECDPEDLMKKNWGQYGCSNSCKSLSSDKVLCNPDYDGEFFLDLSGSNVLCLKGKLSKFSFNSINFRWIRFCIDGKQSLECEARKSICGDGIIQQGEDCKTCPKDVKDPCVDNGGDLCGDGIIQQGEDCKTCPKDVKDPCVDNGGDLCGDGIIQQGEDCKTCPKDVKDPCVDNGGDLCGDGIIQQGEDCKTCPKDVKDPCVDNGGDLCGDGIIQQGEDCKTCPKDVKDPCIDSGDDLCGDGIIQQGEDCKTCPKDVKDPCVDNGGDLCGDGIIQQREDCKTCPKDVGNCEPDIPVIVPYNSGWHIENDNCNICPCEYVDFFSDFVQGDTVRAKLWDKKLSVFYRYSNPVAVDRFIDIR